MNKKCEVCEKPLIKLKNESNARFAKKRTCGTLHARELLKKEKRGWYSREKASMDVPSELDDTFI